MRTMHELRIDIRDKIPELEVRLEMEGREIGLYPIQLSEADMEAFYDGQCLSRCQDVLLACEALQPWLYEVDDEDEQVSLGFESALVAWLDEDEERIYRDICRALEDFPSEVRDCNKLLTPMLDDARTRGLADEDLFEYVWLMMSPFLTGREQIPTEADWQQKHAELTLERAVEADNQRQCARKTLESSIVEALSKDREYTLSLLLGILADANKTIDS
jgi:hypothetical protein